MKENDKWITIQQSITIQQMHYHFTSLKLCDFGTGTEKYFT